MADWGGITPWGRASACSIATLSQRLGQGFAWTWRITTLTITGFGKILSGAIPLKDSLAGPLGIAREIGRQADQGWRNVVFFAAGISINLAVLNLLPIPVLDGGHLLFFVFEIVLGKPLSVRAREMAQRCWFTCPSSVNVASSLKRCENVLQ